MSTGLKIEKEQPTPTPVCTMRPSIGTRRWYQFSERAQQYPASYPQCCIAAAPFPLIIQVKNEKPIGMLGWFWASIAPVLPLLILVAIGDTRSYKSQVIEFRPLI